MSSAATVQQQRPAAFWIYAGFIAAEIIGFVGLSSSFATVTALVLFLVVGVWAYFERGRDSVLDTHYRFQIRTFWINVVAAVVLPLFFLFAVLSGVGNFLMGLQNDLTGLVFSVLAGTILPVLIALGLSIWTIVRSVAGLSRLQDGKPIDNPTTWTI
jgi:uncharacterized membrane protein